MEVRCPLCGGGASHDEVECEARMKAWTPSGILATINSWPSEPGPMTARRPSAQPAKAVVMCCTICGTAIPDDLVIDGGHVPGVARVIQETWHNGDSCVYIPNDWIPQVEQ